jgi:hypothetical protein
MRDEQGQSNTTSNIVAFPLRGKFSEQAREESSDSDIPLHVFLNDSLEADGLYALEDFDSKLKNLLQDMNVEFSIEKQAGRVGKGDVYEKRDVGLSLPFSLETWTSFILTYLDEVERTNPPRYERYIQDSQKAENPEIELLLVAGLGLINENVGYRKFIDRLQEALPKVKIETQLTIEDMDDGCCFISPSIMIGPALGRPRDLREDIRAYVEGKNHLRPVPSL